MVSVEYREAIVEILDILDNSDEEIYEKIPSELIEFWKKNKSDTYKPKLDHSKPLNQMELKEKTKAIIGMIYLNYLCDTKEKEEIRKIIMDNEKEYQSKLREKYNPENIFREKDFNKSEDENKKLIKYEETIIGKIKRLIMKIIK